MGRLGFIKHRSVQLIQRLFTAILLLCSLSVSAQRFPFFNINIENGLIQSQATCLAQDLSGHLWIGTLGGLSKYDGNSFVNYTVRDGLADNTTSSIACDKAGNVWVGSTGGLTRFDGRTMQRFTFQTKDNPNSNNVTSIRIAADSTVWCLAAGKVYNVKKGKSAAFNLPVDKLLATSILPIDNGLWMTGNDGALYRYENKAWTNFNTPVNAAGKHPFITKLFSDSKKRLWLLSNSGLYFLAGDSVAEFRIKGKALDYFPMFNAMAEDSRHHYWIATSSGALCFNDSSIQYYTKKNGLSDNGFDDVLADAEDNIWLAADGQGLFRFSGAVFTGLDESVGLPTAQIMSIAATRNNILFLGSYDGGLFQYANGVVTPVPFPNGLKQTITAITVRNGYDVWLAMRGSGLWRYDGYKITQIDRVKNKLPGNFVSSLYTDMEGRVWIGYGNGAVVYEHDSFHVLTMGAAAVEAFIEIGKDSMLMATNTGIKLYDGFDVSPFVTGSAPDSAFAQCFTLRGNMLWIGTSDNGIIAYDFTTGKSVVFNKSNGLKSDFIYNIIKDNDGNIWAGTGFGIHKISFENNEPAIHFYGRGQGVTGMESNHNAVLKMPDGSIWFGTTNGALRYTPGSVMSHAKPISIVMQSVKLHGEDITDTSFYDTTDAWYHVPYNLHLPYRDNNITFSFHGISLSGGEQLYYRYRIDGLDGGWSGWATTTSVTYSALPPGKYTFQVQCRSLNQTEQKELKYSFEIIAPFHKTNLFRFLIFAGCILLGVTIQYIVNRRKLNRQKLLERLRREEQNKVRERTSEDFHDEVGNKLTRINVLTNVLKSKIPNLSPDALRIIGQIQDNTGQLYSGTRDILWSLKPSNDNLYEILHRIRDFGADLYQDTEVEFNFYGTDEAWKNYRLPLDVSRNLIMIFKEALNNSLKYSQATQIKLSAELKQGNALQLKLVDNGIGFDMDIIKKGHGLQNMNVRAKRINGKLYIDTVVDRGTVITLTFRIPEMM